MSLTLLMIFSWLLTLRHTHTEFVLTTLKPIWPCVIARLCHGEKCPSFTNMKTIKIIFTIHTYEFVYGLELEILPVESLREAGFNILLDGCGEGVNQFKPTSCRHASFCPSFYIFYRNGFVFVFVNIPVGCHNTYPFKHTHKHKHCNCDSFNVVNFVKFVVQKNETDSRGFPCLFAFG